MRAAEILTNYVNFNYLAQINFSEYLCQEYSGKLC
jgi:hypothetical protein